MSQDLVSAPKANHSWWQIEFIGKTIDIFRRPLSNGPRGVRSAVRLQLVDGTGVQCLFCGHA